MTDNNWEWSIIRYFASFISGFCMALILRSDTVTEFTDKHNIINWIGG
mgnify:FL=1